MKPVFLLIAALFVGHIKRVYAQSDVSVKYAATITAEELKQHLMFIASDSCQGRETGTIGQVRAQEYIQNEFGNCGLQAPVNGSFLQQVDLSREDFLQSKIVLGDTAFNFIQDFYFFWLENRNSSVFADNVFLGYGINHDAYSDYQKAEVEGKAVWILSGEPKNSKGNYILSGNDENSDWAEDISIKYDEAVRNGASALVVVNMDYRMYISRVRNYLQKPGLKLNINRDLGETGKGEIPLLYVSPMMANYMLYGEANKWGSVNDIAAFIAKKEKPVSFEFNLGWTFTPMVKGESLNSPNILGYLEGTDKKDELLVITAHYDHVGMNGKDIFNGADDDGSGTVTVLELAEAFSLAAREGNRPRRSILFMTVTGEEKGLLGSEWYTEYPIFPLEKTIANLNIDMIGRVDEKHGDNERYIYLIGSDKLSTELHAISEKANATYAGLELDYTYNDPNDPNRFYYRSDHYNFAKNNIPVIFYFSGVHEDYHKPTDTPEKIRYPKMAEIGKLIFHTAWELANRDERIAVDVENEFK
jgi:hypothetical protein